MRSNIKYAIAAFVGTLALAALLFLFSPFFYISELIIEGNMQIGRDEIVNRLDVSPDTNILFFNTRAARRRVMENLYIGEVLFQREIPGRLNVTVRERRPMAYVQHSPGSFLVLDDFGRVIDIQSRMSDSLPELKGLRFTSFQLGEILEVPDTADFNVVVQYAQLLYLHELLGRVSNMMVNDASNIRIFIYNIEFNVGGGADADQKIRTIVEILNELPNSEIIPAWVDLREIRDQFFMTILQ